MDVGACGTSRPICLLHTVDDHFDGPIDASHPILLKGVLTPGQQKLILDGIAQACSQSSVLVDVSISESTVFDGDIHARQRTAVPLCAFWKKMSKDPTSEAGTDSGHRTNMYLAQATITSSRSSAPATLGDLAPLIPIPVETNRFSEVNLWAAPSATRTNL